MLLTRTDIDTVYLSRTTDSQQVSLSQRVDRANALAADYFHSIHSNAAGPQTNYLFVLWAQLPSLEEPAPPYAGGRAMAEEMGPALADAMRIPAVGTNGGFGECAFYGAGSCRSTVTTPKGSRNFVQSFSLMPSTLSEAGFHTSPVQNQRNMNADWKRLEAQAMYWGILDYHGVPRSVHRIASGIVTDAESGRPINGATVEIDGQTYTTDTFESLFNQFSNDPDELANGFYYLEDLGPGTHTVTVSAPDYRTVTGQITMEDTEVTFFDAVLVSTVPPTVVASDPAPGDPSFPVTDALEVRFSRPMDPATTAPAFSLVQAGGVPVAGEVSFENDGYTLVFDPTDPLAARTEFTLTVAGSATTEAGDPLDGDGDGTGGDAFSLMFTSSFPDTAAPRLTESYPAPNAQDADLRPVVTVVFSEPVVPETLEGRVSLETNETGAPVAGRFVHELAGVVGDDPAPRSTVSFVPDAPLAPGTRYRFSIEPGVEDRFENASESRYGFVFRTGETEVAATAIDGFEGASITENWWVPQQSGSTEGIVTDSTDAAASDRALPTGGAASMRIDYGWDDGVGPWLIREYLAGGPPRSVTFSPDVTLRAHVFGDGTGTLFRFALDDGFDGGHEVSPWTAVDWYGWRPVEWDLDADGFGTWIGNGAWDSQTLRFDSFQLAYDGAAGSPLFGEVYVDDLQTLTRRSVASEDDGAAGDALAVSAARPNPFRDRTEVRFALGAPAEVTVRVFNVLGQEVAVLAEGEPFAPGTHGLVWDARGLAAGVYVARVDAAGESRTVQVVLTR